MINHIISKDISPIYSHIKNIYSQGALCLLTLICLLLILSSLNTPKVTANTAKKNLSFTCQSVRLRLIYLVEWMVIIH